MGTPLRTVIEEVGGGAEPGHGFTAAMSGVANPLVPAAAFDIAVSYEAMTAIGSGLGAAGFIVFDDRTDPVALVHGIARFLSVESCGQCTPCEVDGLAAAEALDRLRREEGSALDLLDVRKRLERVTEGARCNLALQQQKVIGSVLDVFAVDDARRSGREPVEPIAPIADLLDGRVILETDQLGKQPDWTFEARDSGQTPAARLSVTSVPTEGER